MAVTRAYNVIKFGAEADAVTGGVVINKKFQALDAEGKPITGLHAVGQNGLSGQILWGHGLHIAWAITSGRLVGKQLAEERK